MPRSHLLAILCALTASAATGFAEGSACTPDPSVQARIDAHAQAPSLVRRTYVQGFLYFVLQNVEGLRGQASAEVLGFLSAPARTSLYLPPETGLRWKAAKQPLAPHLWQHERQAFFAAVRAELGYDAFMKNPANSVDAYLAREQTFLLEQLDQAARVSPPARPPVAVTSRPERVLDGSYAVSDVGDSMDALRSYRQSLPLIESEQRRLEFEQSLARQACEGRAEEVGFGGLATSGQRPIFGL